jgi:hypothetical protein
MRLMTAVDLACPGRPVGRSTRLFHLTTVF